MIFCTLLEIEKQKKFSIVQDVFLLGTTLKVSQKSWCETRSVVSARIKALPLSLISDKMDELVSLGLEKGPGENSLTICTTKALISLIRTFVSFSVCTQTPYHFFFSPFSLRRRQGVAYWLTWSSYTSHLI